LKDDKIVYQDAIELKSSHSQTLMPRIDYAFNLLGIDKKEIKAVTVSIGPGYFTGIRIGLATAKGICKGLQIPLIPLNTLQILAANAYGTDKKIMTLLDARMNQKYISIFDKDLNVLLENQCVGYDLLNDHSFMKENLEGDFICLGFTKFIRETDKLKIALPHQHTLLASAQFSLLKHKNIELNYDKVFISNIEPNYVRSYKG
jgi:tRNA threonylcarbamoyl adenosine modification protein YeaZ